MKLAILADTHIPKRQDEIPEKFREMIRDADHVIHAGDFTSKEVLKEVREMSSGFTGVHGNMDPHEIGLPTVDSVELEGITFVVTHGTSNVVKEAVFSHGMVKSKDDWLDAIADPTRIRADEPRVGVGGHIHEVVDEVHEGVRVLNPGTATGANPDDDTTMMTAEVEDGDVDVTLHEL